MTIAPAKRVHVYPDSEVEWQDRQADSHWWHVGRRRILSSLLRHFLSERLHTPAVLLEVGCGVGGFWREIVPFAQPVGLDSSLAAIRRARLRGYPHLLQADVVDLPVRSDSVHGLLALDILEHIEQDGQALREYFRSLRPGGLLFVTVPAHPWMWSDLDERAGHVRRYRRRELQEKIRSAGFFIQKFSYLNSVAFPIAAPVRLAQRALKRWFRFDSSSMEPPGHAGINRLLAACFASEGGWLLRGSLPFGLSLICVARKPN